MNSRVLAILLACALPVIARAAPINKKTSFDGEGRFVVEVLVPAGSRHAVLEMAGDPGTSQPWRKMIAGGIDGRAATVTFRLPPQGTARMFARVRTGPETTAPAVELSDPSLYSIVYAGTIQETTKIQFLGQARLKMLEWDNLPRAQTHANLIAWALLDPNVESAVVSTLADNVCITFSDGDMCVLMNKPRWTDGSQPYPGTSIPPAEDFAAETRVLSSPATAAAATAGLPGNNRAIAAFALDPATFPNSAPTVAGWLRARGYDTRVNAETSVGDIMSWSSDTNPIGALFWHAHGVSIKNGKGEESIAIVTREMTDPFNPGEVYRSLRETGELMLAQEKDDEFPFYMITPKFIRNKMKFAPHSIVMLDACYGSNEDLAKAFLAAGAGSYISWDWYSGQDSGTSCLQLFDRLLGMNAQTPVSTPPERSFSLAAVTRWMRQKGYDIDPSPTYKNQGRRNARLVTYHHAEHPGSILMPSIMRVLSEAPAPNEQFAKYLLEGDFGDDPGASKRSVMWGNKEMTVVKWNNPGSMVIRIPSPAPVGNLRVVIKDKFDSPSNNVPVTEWTVPFTFQRGGEGSQLAKFDIRAKFRGDVRGYRAQPQEEIRDLGVVFANLNDLTGTFAASGQHVDGGTTTTWSGGNNLFSLNPGEPGTGVLKNLIICSGVLNIWQGTASQFLLSSNSDYTSTDVWYDEEGGRHEKATTRSTSFNSQPLFLLNPLKFNPTTFNVLGGSREETSSDFSDLSWPTVAPQMAPTADTPR